jgi:hypothetical protein
MTLLATALVDSDNHTVISCAWCSQRFYRAYERHRFCSLDCGVKFFQAERKAALAFYRALQEDGDERKAG